MEFRFINHKDLLLEKVIALGKKNSQTLGLMPRDAYIDQARKKCIVVVHLNETLIGYCLFRVTNTKRRIGITQVCVETGSRGKGIAKLLLDQVKDKYKSLLAGMLVSCRKDYLEACKLYSKYGFVIKSVVRSRSVEENFLNKFWYSFDQKDLFSVDNDLNVALDLNILIKLRDQNQDAQEILQLLSDWLIDEVDYCYAKETFNEIHRDTDAQRARSTIQFLISFKEVTGDPVESQKLMSLLRELHPGESDNHESDRKQLAECKVGNVSYFVTIDEELISRRDNIYDKLGVNILRPGEFILEIDELKNRKLYEPSRLQGAQYQIKRIDSSELLQVIDIFLQTDKGEKKSEFKSLVLPFVSDIKTSIAKGVKTPSDEFILLYGLKYFDKYLEIKFIRIKDLSIANTLFNQIIVEVIQEAVIGSRPIITIATSSVTDDQVQILIANGFYFENDYWKKIVVSGICNSADLLTCNEIIKIHPEVPNTLEIISSHPDAEIKQKLKLDIERKLWPLKLDDLDIPTFIVPIKPVWAAKLFDHLSVNSQLFGSPAELTWSKENVYYRSVNPNVEIFPARILWYASQENGFERQMAIVACSYLNNVVVGEAKQLYSIFKRFGTYEWTRIMELAKGEAKGKIKVLQFSDTEVFETMIKFDTINDILQSENQKKQTFVSPVKVGHAVFNKVYRLAKGIK